MSEPILSAADLTVSRAGSAVISGVDFSLTRGEALAVIGPNGGGKSTLLQGLRGLLPSTGTLTLDGVDPRRIPRAEVARHVAVVPQRNEFGLPMRVEEMVLLGRAPYRRPWQGWSREDRRIAAEWLECVGLAPLARRSVDTLSGGERRRVFIARALVQETPLLFLDEPLAGLDPAAQEELLGWLVALARDGDRTLVIVLHDVARVEELCTHVLGIREGRALFGGACATALDPAALGDLYGVGWEEARRPGGGRVLVPRSRAGDRGAS